MILGSLKVVLIVENFSVFLLEFLILSFDQVKLIVFGLKDFAKIIKFSLELLNLLHVNVSFFSHYPVLLLQLFILVLASE